MTACNEELDNDKSVQSSQILFSTSAKFLKLQDDSTKVAGVLEIMAPTPSVKLRWNVSPECNLDTTVTELKLSGGKCQLPIKWNNKLKEGSYGPMYSAYMAGVQISAGEDIQYVPLVWADEVDSLKLMEIIEQMPIQTRADASPDVDRIIIYGDQPIRLGQDTCASFTFKFSTSTCNTGKADLENDIANLGYNLDVTNVKTLYFPSGTYKIQLNWTADGAPEMDFMAHLKLYSGGFGKYAYFQYKVPKAKEWEFLSCIPDSLSELPAKDAIVVAIANTNRGWSLKYRNEDGSEIVSNSEKDVSGEQSLLIRIPENTALTKRTILVDVYSENVLDRTLRFTQAATEGSFSIISVSPKPEDGTLSAEEQKIKVTVDTARDWWIAYGGTYYNFLASQSEGEVTIPAYAGTTNRDVVITVGYDKTLVNTYTYTQGIGDLLKYESNDMPSKIPVDGGTYTFIFSGNYIGNLQVRAVLADGTIIATSPSTTNKQPALTIPNNYTNRDERNLIFEYKKGSEDWAPLNETRVQDKATFLFDVLPTINIPREGTTISGVFSGTYRGTIKMKAMHGSTELVTGEGATPGSINLLIPPITGTEDREIEFFYQLNGETAWTSMGKRTQIAGTIIAGTVTPTGNIPANGGTYNCSFSGTYPGDITFRAQSGAKTLATQTGRLPITFNLTIPANTETSQRNVVFEYSKDGITWIPVETRVQTSNIPVEGGDNNVGDFEDGEHITGGKEV